MPTKENFIDSLFGKQISEMSDEEIQKGISDLRAQRSERSSTTREKTKKKNKLIHQMSENAGPQAKIKEKLKDIPPEMLAKIKALLEEV